MCLVWCASLYLSLSLSLLSPLSLSFSFSFYFCLSLSLFLSSSLSLSSFSLALSLLSPSLFSLLSSLLSLSLFSLSLSPLSFSPSLSSQPKLTPVELPTVAHVEQAAESDYQPPDSPFGSLRQRTTKRGQASVGAAVSYLPFGLCPA